MTTQQEKDVIDKVAAKVAARRKAKVSSDAATKSASTPDGLSVAGQIRKEWNSKKDGGLQTPLK